MQLKVRVKLQLWMRKLAAASILSKLCELGSRSAQQNQHRSSVLPTASRVREAANPLRKQTTAEYNLRDLFGRKRRCWHVDGITPGTYGLLFCWLTVLCLGSAEILWGIMVQKSLWITGEKACLITLSAGWEKPSRNFPAPSFFSLFFVFFFFRWFLLIICHPSPLR